MSSSPILRVGVLMKAKKTKKFCRRLEADYPEKEKKCEYIPIDTSRPFEDQGDFDILLVKPNDWLVKGLFYEDTEALAFQKKLEEYISRNPNIAIVESPENVLRILDRGKIHNHILSTNHPKIKSPESVIVTRRHWAEIRMIHSNKAKAKRNPPPSTLLSKLRGLRYPIIGKSLVSCGSRDAHRMILAPSYESLVRCLDEDVKADKFDQKMAGKNVKKMAGNQISPAIQSRCEYASGWLLQELLAHDGYIYKVYVLGDHKGDMWSEADIQVSREKSLPNLTLESIGPDAMIWNSHDAPPKLFQSNTKTEKESKPSMKHETLSVKDHTHTANRILTSGCEVEDNQEKSFEGLAVNCDDGGSWNGHPRDSISSFDEKEDSQSALDGSLLREMREIGMSAAEIFGLGAIGIDIIVAPHRTEAKSPNFVGQIQANSPHSGRFCSDVEIDSSSASSIHPSRSNNTNKDNKTTTTSRKSSSLEVQVHLKDSHRHRCSMYVVDVNFLPSYKALSDEVFRERLDRYLWSCRRRWPNIKPPSDASRS